jgi:hypothetical protein
MATFTEPGTLLPGPLSLSASASASAPVVVAEGNAAELHAALCERVRVMRAERLHSESSSSSQADATSSAFLPANPSALLTSGAAAPRVLYFGDHLLGDVEAVVRHAPGWIAGALVEEMHHAAHWPSEAFSAAVPLVPPFRILGASKEATGTSGEFASESQALADELHFQFDARDIPEYEPAAYAEGWGSFFGHHHDETGFDATAATAAAAAAAASAGTEAGASALPASSAVPLPPPSVASYWSAFVQRHATVCVACLTDLGMSRDVYRH